MEDNESPQDCSAAVTEGLCFASLICCQGPGAIGEPVGESLETVQVLGGSAELASSLATKMKRQR